jgi:hypothetical protein
LFYDGDDRNESDEDEKNVDHKLKTLLINWLFALKSRERKKEKETRVLCVNSAE